MIVIAGDSWGIGSWTDGGVTGANFVTIASLHHDNELGSANLSRCNSTLSQALDTYEKFLNRYTPDYTDTFYWILTNPLRNIDITNIKTWTTIKEAANNILNDNLQRADRLAGNFKIKINLIGGLCDLDPSVVSGLDNLVCAVPSWCSLLSEKHVESIFNQDHNWEEIGIFIKEHRSDLLDEWLVLSDFVLSKNNFYIQHPTYFKQRDTHPSVKGNRVLKNYLYPEWIEVF
jgi:hypothetical protein